MTVMDVEIYPFVNSKVVKEWCIEDALDSLKQRNMMDLAF